MSYENSAGLGVNNHYGVRDTQDGIVGGGKLESSGSIQEAVVYFKASDFTVESATVAAFDTQLSLPAPQNIPDLSKVSEMPIKRPRF